MENIKVSERVTKEYSWAGHAAPKFAVIGTGIHKVFAVFAIERDAEAYVSTCPGAYKICPVPA